MSYWCEMPVEFGARRSGGPDCDQDPIWCQRPPRRRQEQGGVSNVVQRRRRPARSTGAARSWHAGRVWNGCDGAEHLRVEVEDAALVLAARSLVGSVVASADGKPLEFISLFEQQGERMTYAHGPSPHSRRYPKGSMQSLGR